MSAETEASGHATTASPPAGTPAELLFPDLDVELSSTRRMLERAPREPADWRPHEKSMTLATLAAHLAELPGFPALILEHDELDMPASEFQLPEVVDADERLATLDEESAKLRDLIDGLTWERAMETWTMRIDGEVVMQGVRSVMVRNAGLSHMAHHRAQLGVYLRMLDIPIPGTYGPSADEPWGEETSSDRSPRDQEDR